jgi:hypothetical protein
MTKPILLVVAAATVGVTAVALPGLVSSPPVVSASADPVFTGLCDASAGLFLDAKRLVVANDEDPDKTTLRVYDVTQPGGPIGSMAATDALKPEPNDGEVDLEGLTRFGSQFVTIGSHSRKKKNPPLEAPSRHRILAFNLSAGHIPTIEPKGLYKDLIKDAQRALANLPATDALKGFVLDDPAKGSKDGGLSIEAVTETATPGELLIGLRSPLGPGDTAIVLHLKNAGDVLTTGAKPSFARPILLDLRGKGPTGQGLRDLVRDGKGGYLLIAGDKGDGGTFALWKWSGPGGTPSHVSAIDRPTDVKKASAEALAIAENGAAAWVLFDEGEREDSAKVECKDLTDPKQQSFHARRIALPGS